MLAMVVNDDAGSLMPRGVFRFFASMLAPTGGQRRLTKSAGTKKPLESGFFAKEADCVTGRTSL